MEGAPGNAGVQQGHQGWDGRAGLPGNQVDHADCDRLPDTGISHAAAHLHICDDTAHVKKFVMNLFAIHLNSMKSSKRAALEVRSP